MKKAGLVLLIFMSLLMSACGSSTDEMPSEATTETATEVVVPYDSTAAHLKFAEVLTNMLENKALPDGRTVDDMGSTYENTFAVADVDGDSRDELVILYETTSVAGMTGYVLAYSPETGTAYTKFQNFPSFTFYENGLLSVGWSHNQGHGEMWPYTLFRYNSETNTYDTVAIVDSWDEAIKSEDYPKDIDTEGAGTVYYLQKGTAVDDSDIYNEDNLVSKSDYEKWVDEVGLNAEPIELSYKNLTEENINSIK